MKYTTVYVKYDALGMVIEELKFLDDRETADCKGSGVANQQRQQELDMQKQSFDAQQKQLAMLNDKLSPYLEGSGQGYDPALLAALQTQFLNSNDQAFNSAGSQLRTSLLARGAGGGNAPIGGTGVQGLVGLDAARANSQSQGMNTINLNNLQQALNNRWNAANVLSGNAATQGNTIGSTGQAASSALQSYIQAKNTGFMSSLANSLGSTLGKGLGSMATGGISGGLGMIPGVGQVI